jgi:hypothetical protein
VKKQVAFDTDVATFVIALTGSAVLLGVAIVNAIALIKGRIFLPHITWTSWVGVGVTIWMMIKLPWRGVRFVLGFDLAIFGAYIAALIAGAPHDVMWVLGWLLELTHVMVYGGLALGLAVWLKRKFRMIPAGVDSACEHTTGT